VRGKYTKIFVTNREAWLPATYLLFAHDFNQKYIGRFKQNFRVSTIDSISFPESDCLSHEMSSKKAKDVLYVVPADCEVDESKYQVVHTIYRLNNTSVFKAYVFSPTL
jgi:hypothetical protein